MAYQALVTGLQGAPFRDLGPAERAAQRQRFEAIKRAASPAPDAAIEAALDAIGVGRRR